MANRILLSLQEELIPPAWFDEAKNYIQANIDFTQEYLAANSPKIKVVRPEGSYLVWLDFSAFT